MSDQNDCESCHANPATTRVRHPCAPNPMCRKCAEHWKPCEDCDISGDCQARKPVWKKWKERAEKAEARVAELESHLILMIQFDEQRKKQRWDLEAQILELTPPEGHLAVMLPREIVRTMARVEIDTDWSCTMTKAAQKALEAED